MSKLDALHADALAALENDVSWVRFHVTMHGKSVTPAMRARLMRDVHRCRVRLGKHIDRIEARLARKPRVEVARS